MTAKGTKRVALDDENMADLRAQFLAAAANGRVTDMKPYLEAKDPLNKPMMLLSAFAPAIQRGHKDAARLILEEAPKHGITVEELGFFADEAGQSRLFAALLYPRN